MTSQKKPRVILGLMNFGPDVEWGARITSLAEFNKFLDLLQESGYNEVDTARQYQRGAQEAFTAAAKWKERGLKLATKVYPVTPGQHSPATITSMFNESLSALETTSVDIFYLHAPDRSVPFVDTLRAVNELYKQGKFKQLGLSNYTAFEVAEIVVTCKERGWVRPTVYQGRYNAITRILEPELIAACRRYGLDVVVYNPLAGGFFTGKYKPPSDTVPMETNGEISGTLTSKTQVASTYQKIYFSDVFFDALSHLSPILLSHNLTHVEVALRWLVHHSALNIKDGGNDGIILGASSVEQLRGSLEAVGKGMLPEEVVEALDEAWERTRGKATTYWHKDLMYGYGFDDEEKLEKKA
ncbi:NADP-dependent oxidoreductase domain-containing protein [Tricladium varicosporioides]|nr:NADP-dependent oxidoreductase domain-containing protein [Hymenoscyphus varicosporioides]